MKTFAKAFAIVVLLGGSALGQSPGALNQQFSFSAAGDGAWFQPLVNNGATLAGRHTFHVDVTGAPATCTLNLDGRATSSLGEVDVTTGVNPDISDCSQDYIFERSLLLPWMRVSITALVGSEPLTENAFSSSANWAEADDWAEGAGVETYTHSAGSGTLTHASGDFDVPAEGGATYTFKYDIANTVGGSNVTCQITTAFAASAVPLDIADGTNKTVSVVAKSSPGDFVISCTSTDTSSFDLDNVTLTSVPAAAVYYTGTR